MKAHNGIFPLKQLKQLWIVVAHERVAKNLFLKPNTPQEVATNWTLFRKTKCHWPCLWCKNNFNCELNSSMLAAIYVGTVQYSLCRPLEDSGCSVETLHVVSWPFLCPANYLCLTRAMQQHNYPWCPLLPQIVPPGCHDWEQCAKYPSLFVRMWVCPSYWSFYNTQSKFP